MIYCNQFIPFKDLECTRGIIFDCDGVLFDSREANKIYYNRIKEYLGLPPMSPEEEEYVHSYSVLDSIARIVPEERYEEACNARQKIDYKSVIPYMRPEPGLYETLDTIRNMGLRMAINTNRTTTMDFLLERYDLVHYFSPVVTASKVSLSKPHPESLFLILDQWKLEYNQVIYVGDSRVDEQTAHGAGVRFWAYKNEGLMAELHIQDFWSLKQFLKAQKHT